MKTKILAIVGKAGSGKDTILKAIASDKKYNQIVRCTTRPKRENEIDGIDYYFVEHDDFIDMVEEHQILDITIFRDWCYGTPIKSLVKDKINVGVYNPESLEMLLEIPQLDVFPVYINATDKERLMRQLTREQNPDCAEIIRRFGTDKEDFTFILNTDIKYIDNPDGKDVTDVIKDIEDTISSWTSNINNE